MKISHNVSLTENKIEESEKNKKKRCPRYPRDTLENQFDKVCEAKEIERERAKKTSK
jgi:hypothetical protein